MIRKNLTLYHDLVATTVISIANGLTDGELRLKEIRFAHGRPDYAEEYARVFHTPIIFDCLRNEIIFDRDQLREPLLTSYPEYHDQMQQLAHNKLRSLELGLSLEARVAGFVSRNLGVQPTQLEEVAAYFNMTPRTLQRKLKQEGTSFVAVRDRCRHARALRDLGDPAIEIETLAEVLGFSDTSNFYHAFKRWEGMSPGSYRKQALEERRLS